MFFRVMGEEKFQKNFGGKIFGLRKIFRKLSKNAPGRGTPPGGGGPLRKGYPFVWGTPQMGRHHPGGRHRWGGQGFRKSLTFCKAQNEHFLPKNGKIFPSPKSQENLLGTGTLKQRKPRTTNEFMNKFLSFLEPPDL
jgi:hypothetical protein